MLLALIFHNVNAQQILKHAWYRMKDKLRVAYKRKQQPYYACTYRKGFLRSHVTEFRSLDTYRLHLGLRIEGSQTFVESDVPTGILGFDVLDRRYDTSLKFQEIFACSGTILI